MKLNVIIIGILVRLHFITYHRKQNFYDYTYPVDDRPEYSTAQTNYKFLKEYSLRLSSGMPVYQEGRCLPAPLSLKTFQIVSNRLWIPFLIGVDLMAAMTLEKEFHPILGIGYFLNPLAIMATVSKSWGPFDNLLFIKLLSSSLLRGQSVLAGIFLAISSYFAFYPIVQLPLLLMVSDLKNRLKTIFSFISIMFMMILTSRYISGSWDFIKCTFGCHLLFLDFRPNIGLWWYLFVEMFDHFRPFFLAAFQLLVFVHVLPLVVKFYKIERLFCAFIVQATVNILKPYPSVSDLALMTTLGYYELTKLRTAKDHESSNYNQVQFIKCLAVYGGGFLTLMIPKVWHFWIIQGSGNANFYFAGTCAINLLQIISVIMMVKLKLERALILENPQINSLLSKVIQ